jgi:ribosome maturation protein Sdo1
MNFVMRRPALPLVIQKAMEKSGHHYDHEKDVPPQMKPLPEIVKEIEAMRAEFSRLTIF